MYKRSAIASLTLLLLPLSAAAFEVATSATTVVRYEKQSTPGFAVQQLLPATQFLSADLEELGDGHLSFHFSGWGRVDLADQSDISGTSAANLTTAHLTYRFPKANAELKAGRFFVFAGGSVEQLDGVSARSDLLELYEGLALHLYAGKPVTIARTNDNKGDYLAGGRLSYRIAAMAEVGATILHEGGAISNSFVPALNSFRQEKGYRQLVGGDLWLSPHPRLTIEGQTLYNTATNGVAEHSYRLAVRPVGQLRLTGSYDRRAFNNFFAAASNPSLFKPFAGQDLTSVGASAAYPVNDHTEVITDYRQFERTNIGSAKQGGGELRLALLDAKLRGGVGYHRLGAPSGINSFHELRGYLAYDPGRYQLSIDAIGHRYDYPVYLNSNRLAHEVIISAGYRLLPTLLLSADLSSSRTPQFGDEIKGLVRLDFSHTTKQPGVGQ